MPLGRYNPKHEAEYVADELETLPSGRGPH